MPLLTLKLEPGQEIMATLKEEFTKRELASGAIVSAIGAVSECTLSNMDKSAPEKDIVKTYKAHLEFSGTGEIRDGEPHIHATISDETEIAIHGHLHAAIVEPYMAVYVLT